jgi:hypothetical protein
MFMLATQHQSKIYRENYSFADDQDSQANKADQADGCPHLRHEQWGCVLRLNQALPP